MGKPSQRKGRAGELELARILRGRGYGVRPGRARSYGAEADVSGLPGVHVELRGRSACASLRPFNRPCGTLSASAMACPQCSTAAAARVGW